MLASLQSAVVLVLALGAVGLTGWALVDCLLRKDAAFVAAGKVRRRVWMIICAAALGISVVAVPPPVGTGGGVGGLLSIASIVAAGVYLADVRPAVRDAAPRRRKRSRGMGPWDDQPPAWRS